MQEPSPFSPSGGTATNAAKSLAAEKLQIPLLPNSPLRKVFKVPLRKVFRL